MWLSSALTPSTSCAKICILSTPVALSNRPIILRVLRPNGKCVSVTALEVGNVTCVAAAVNDSVRSKRHRPLVGFKPLISFTLFYISRSRLFLSLSLYSLADDHRGSPHRRRLRAFADVRTMQMAPDRGSGNVVRGLAVATGHYVAEMFCKWWSCRATSSFMKPSWGSLVHNSSRHLFAISIVCGDRIWADDTTWSSQKYQLWAG